MGESITSIRIFVSSPGDVRVERGVLDEVIARINRMDGEVLGVRLELFRWENNIVPQVGLAAQQVVDSQTPPYDVYLGIMAHRFGTPTAEFGSGTEAEFRQALAMYQVCLEWHEDTVCLSSLPPRRGSSPSSDVHHQNYLPTTIDPPPRCLPAWGDVP